MSEKVITLDNPVFRGRLRPLQQSVANDRPKNRGVLLRSVTHDAWIDVYKGHEDTAPAKKQDHTVEDTAKLYSQDFATTELPGKHKQTAELQESTQVRHQTLLFQGVLDKLCDVSLPFASKKPYAKRTYRLFRFRKNFAHNALLVLAVLLFVAGAAVVIQTFLLNKKLESPSGPVANAATSPEEKKPQRDEIYDYKVAPDMPRFVRINNIEVFARVVPVGKNAKHQIESPVNVHDAGWYTASSKPGQGKGASLLDGHVSGWTEKGIFYRLHELNTGDTIEIERGDGKKLFYEVVTKKEYDVKKVDMKAALNSSDPNKQGLNIITCSGSVKGNSYTKRLVVFAVQK